MIREIKLIKSVNDLEEYTTYFEFLPGKFNYVFKNDESVYIHEEVMSIIEYSFASSKNFDHYYYADITREEWNIILNSLCDFKKSLLKANKLDDMDEQISFIWSGTKKHFDEDFLDNRAKLIERKIPI